MEETSEDTKDNAKELSGEENVGEINNTERSIRGGDKEEGVKEIASAAQQTSEWYYIFLNLMDRSVADSLT